MVSSLFLLFVKLINKTVKIICHSVVRDQNTLKMHCSWRMYFLTLFFPGGESRISLEAGLLLAEPAVPCERKQQGLQPPCNHVRGWEGSSQTTGAAVNVSTLRPQSWAAGKNYHQQTWAHSTLSGPQGIFADAFSVHLSWTSLFQVGVSILKLGRWRDSWCGVCTVVLLFLAYTACAFQCSGYVLIYWTPKYGT